MITFISDLTEIRPAFLDLKHAEERKGVLMYLVQTRTKVQQIGLNYIHLNT